MDSTWDVNNQVIHEISQNFRTASGGLYNRKLDPSTIEVVEIGPFSLTPININDKTKIEKLDEKFKDLSDDDIEFIKNYK